MRATYKYHQWVLICMKQMKSQDCAVCHVPIVFSRGGNDFYYMRKNPEPIVEKFWCSDKCLRFKLMDPNIADEVKKGAF